MAVTVPLPAAQTPFTSQRTTLRGVSYRLDFSWNGRVSRWYLDLFDADDQPIVRSRPLVSGYPILADVTIATRPPGELIVVTSDGLDPDLDTIAQATLLYFEVEE